MKRERFQLGDICGTPGAIAAAEAGGIDLLGLVIRHQRGDWGDITGADIRANETALVSQPPGRIVSMYPTASGSFYVITERDRSATTVMLVVEDR
jgi:hypothetical protein